MGSRKLITVQRHLVASQSIHPDATGHLSALLWDLTISFKIISRVVNKAGLIHLREVEEETNATGDNVQRLDQYSQEVMHMPLI